MMGMQAQFGTIVGHTTFGAHFEWFVAAVAKFEFALRACEVHATAAGKSKLIFHIRLVMTSIFEFQLKLFGLTEPTSIGICILGNRSRAFVNVVLLLRLVCLDRWLPSTRHIGRTKCLRVVVPTVDSIETKELESQNVISQTAATHRFATLCTRDRSAIGTNQALLSGTSKETRRTLNTPFEIRILQQGPIA